MPNDDGLHVEQYLGTWAMHEPMLLEFADHVRNLDLPTHMAAYQAARQTEPESQEPRRYDLLAGGVAVVHMVGMMTKYGSSLSQLRQGTVGVRRAIRQAAEDAAVKAIVLRIDSPGGTFAGTSDLADDVYSASQKKPIIAYIEDLGASAAYFVASQATRVFANAGAVVGSIGTYGVVTDYSGLASKEGIKVHVVRAGQFKGVGTPGTEVTAEQLAELQRTVNDVNVVFTSAVARGRKMTAQQVAALADGRVHVGQGAVAVGLVDAIATMDEAIESVRNPGTGRSANNLKPRSHTMNEQNDAAAQATPAAATLSELKSAFPASTAEWREQCMEQGMTLVQCKDAWIRQLETRAAEAEKRSSEQAAKISQLEQEAKTKPAGNEPLTTGKVDMQSGDAAAQIRQLVNERVAETGKSRHECHALVMKEHPELRQALVAAANAG